MRNSIRAICAAATVLAVAGCGGSGYKSQPASTDGPPSLSVIGDQSIDQDTTTAPIPFSVDDRETAVGQPRCYRDIVRHRHRCCRREWRWAATVRREL